MLYNDRSVQENHHISAAFSLLSRVSLYIKRIYAKVYSQRDEGAMLMQRN